jgi:hypothetical protein
MGRKNKRINRDTTIHDAETIRLRREGKLLLLTRKEIVTRLLDTAMQMWLGEADAISVHILACVAHQNIDAIAVKKGAPASSLKETMDWEDLYSAYNDFKHATGDPNHRDQFVVENNQIILFDCVVSYTNVFSFRTPWMNTFAAYVALQNGVYANDPTDEILQGLRASAVVDLSRKAFVKKVYPLFWDIYRRGFH